MTSVYHCDSDTLQLKDLCYTEEAVVYFRSFCHCLSFSVFGVFCFVFSLKYLSRYMFVCFVVSFVCWSLFFITFSDIYRFECLLSNAEH